MLQLEKHDQNLDANTAKFERYFIAGLPVDLINSEQILQLLLVAASEKASTVLANLNVHGLYCGLTSESMKKLLLMENTVVHIDGTPVAWIVKLLGAKLPRNWRNAHIDLLPTLLRKCQALGWPVVMIGSDEAGALENYSALRQLAPGLNLRTFDGYFDIHDTNASSKAQQIVSSIRNFRPKLMLVGMGMPRQEEWILQVRSQFESVLIMPVGGFADYYSNRNKIPPRFLGPLGLEWMFRLATDPVRLWRRYLLEPFFLLWLFVNSLATGSIWGKR